MRQSENRETSQSTDLFFFEALLNAEEKEGNQHPVEEKSQEQDQNLQDTTITTNSFVSKQSFRHLVYQKAPVYQSCLEDFQEFVKKIPIQEQEEQSLFTKGFGLSCKKEKMERMKVNLKESSNWLSSFELKCTFFFNNKKKESICKIGDALIEFDGEISFRIAKITKLKALFDDNQKVLWFTYDETRVKKTSETRFKVSVNSDAHNDLYILFAKVITEKLLLSDHPVNLSQVQDPHCDKFMMKGTVLKKGQIVNKFKERQLQVSDRIQSFRGGKCTFIMSNIRELWTRFDTLKGNLVIKIWHGKEKTQLAIPMANYPIRYAKDNWLWRIYRILTP